MSTTSRRTKGHPPQLPPPNPAVQHFPRRRRTHRKQPSPTTVHLHPHHRSKSLLLLSRSYLSSRGHLQSLFDQENNELSSDSETSAIERRESVEEERKECGGSNAFEEEKLMLQAEILRAECNFLRMERELALKKLENNRVKMEKTLRSAVHTLVSGREKIFEGKSANTMLEKEIEELSEKLEELHKSSRIKSNEFKNCRNLDKKACLVQRRLERLGELSDESCLNELHELPESGLSVDTSRGKIDTKSSEEPMLHEDNRCSGRCKAIVRKIVEQVRAETEQWSQMQEMLAQVRAEMEQLQAARDFWENRACHSDYEIQSLKHAVEEWREKARGYETKANKLQLELGVVEEQLRKSRAGLKTGRNGEANSIPDHSRKHLEKEKHALSYQLKENRHSDTDEDVYKVIKNAKEELNVEGNEEVTHSKDLAPISLCKQLAEEKRMLLRRLMETRDACERSRIPEREKVSLHGRGKRHENSIRAVALRRSPLRDIRNTSSFSFL